VGGGLDSNVAAVRVAVREECADLEPGASVIVASSGGADSLTLAAAALFEGRHAGWLVGAATVDHGLQDDSRAVAQQATTILADLGCEPVVRLDVEVGDAGGPEGAARAARYAALEALAEESSATILLGHTLDDQAETVLLGLARGSGARSLAGMPRRRGPFRRPLLGVPRATVRAAAAALGLASWEDPHNADPRFARARVRGTVMPTLERELGPGVAAALGRTAELLRDDADALDGWATQVYAAAQGEPGAFAVATLAEAPAAVRTRALRLAAITAGATAGELSATHVSALDALVCDWHGQGAVDLPGSRTARRSGDVIRFA
jgi:tRNA(Ile)-lysidine synthase